MGRTQDVGAVVVDQVKPGFFYPYDVVIPADAALHSLAELGFGYFGALDDIGSDRAVRAIQILNQENQFPAGGYVHVGAGDVPAPIAPIGIPPGGNYYVDIDKLGAVALANYNGVTIVATIAILCIDL